MPAQMGNVLEEQTLVVQRYMIEQHQMLVDLAHVANVGYHSKSELLGQDGHSQVFADSRQSRARTNASIGVCIQVSFAISGNKIFSDALNDQCGCQFAP